MNKKFDSEDKYIQEIREYRKKRRYLKNNPPPVETDPEKIRRKNIVDDFMKKACPSFDKLKNHIEKAADSEWFAMHELERFSKHVDNDHDGNPENCSESCPDCLTREDGIEFAIRIMEYVEKNRGNDYNNEKMAQSLRIDLY